LKNPVYAGFVLGRLFVSRFWDTTVSDPLLKRWMVFCASQSAFTIIVNASVDCLAVFIGTQYFINHSSALHPRYAPFEFDARKYPACPPVKPEVVKLTIAIKGDALSNAGTDDNVKFDPFTRIL
jgi:hypothetical protein